MAVGMQTFPFKIQYMHSPVYFRQQTAEEPLPEQKTATSQKHNW